MLLTFFILTIIISLSTLFSKTYLLQKIFNLIFLIALLGLNVYAIFNIGKTDSQYFEFGSIGVLFSSLLSLLSIASFYHSLRYVKVNKLKIKQSATYYSASLMFIASMISCYYAQDFTVLWVSIEATTLFVSILIYTKSTANALEATWKYLFVSSFGLAIAFIGILLLSIVASGSGITKMDFNNLVLAGHKLDPFWLKIIFVLMVTGFSVKINIFPLFPVAVDAKTIAPSPINALMSTALVNVGFVGIYRIYSIILKSDARVWAQHVLIFVAVVSVFLAAIQITRIKRLKRMYAFSTMEHMGIVLLGLAAGGLGYYAAILHLVFHSLVKAGLFYQIGSIYHSYKTVWIDKMGDYFRRNTLGAMALIFGIISILAIPPSGLFISEFLTFKALFIGKYYIVGILVLSLLAFIMYVVLKNITHVLFHEAEVDNEVNTLKPNPYETVSQFVLFGLVVYLGINPPLYFTDLINSAIAVLN